MKEIGHYAGQKFDRLTIISDTFFEDKQYYCIAVCECGEVKRIRLHHILGGATASCGCFNAERATVHGMCGTPEYNTYVSMISRCKYPTNKQYKDYGGRGIKVDSRWLGDHGFEHFYEDMGKRPSTDHSIDRYPDKNGNYTKDNCRWATEEQQKRNTRRNKWHIFNGETILQKDLLAKIGIGIQQFNVLLKRGETTESIVELYERKNRLGLKKTNSPIA